MNSETEIISAKEATEEPLPVVPDGFEVRDAASANWVVRKIIDARAYRQRVKMWAEAEVRRAEREECFFFQHYGPQLERWTRTQTRDGRRKSVPLPAGVIGFRAQPIGIDVIDEKKCIDWCRRNLPIAIAVQTVVVKTPVSDYFKKTGYCPDGTEVHGGDTKFYVSEARRR